MTKEEMFMYDTIVELDIATAPELNLAMNLVRGSWKDVLNSVVYVRTGYRTLDQFLYELEEEEEQGGFSPYFYFFKLFIINKQFIFIHYPIFF